MKSARSRRALASASPFSAFTSAMVTTAPRECRARTVASPRPEAPPATSAADPSIFIGAQLYWPGTGTVKLTPQMSTGVTFDERMEGYLSPSAQAPVQRDDYRAAYRQGRQAGGGCHFEATMLMQDIASYVRDPQHRA